MWRIDMCEMECGQIYLFPEGPNTNNSISRLILSNL